MTEEHERLLHEMHATVIRIDTKLDAHASAAERRFCDHSERIDETAKTAVRAAAQIANTRAWMRVGAATTVVVVPCLLAVIGYLLSHVPAAAWHVLGK